MPLSMPGVVAGTLLTFIPAVGDYINTQLLGNTETRMLGNVGVDFVVGAIPFIGDLFDFVFKANRKNARLLEEHLHRQSAKASAARPRLTRN